MIFHAHAQYTTHEGLDTRLHIRHTFYYLRMYMYNFISDPKRGGKQNLSYGHPTPTLGIFTLYCTHGICYSFKVMRCCDKLNSSEVITECPLLISYSQGL